MAHAQLSFFSESDDTLRGLVYTCEITRIILDLGIPLGTGDIARPANNSLSTTLKPDPKNCRIQNY